MRLFVPSLALAALSGCAFVSQQDVADQKALIGVDDTGTTGDDTGGDCDNPLTGYTDADGDGFGAGDEVSYCDGVDGFADTATDCDDADATAFPDAVETCDGVDNDCDGTVDDDPTDGVDLYVDSDGDGFGTGTATTGCAGTDGFATNDSDCNDTRDDINPDATEICNDVDDDCSGAIDDNADDASTWYTDGDSDGFGADSSAELACNPPSSFHTDIGGDCDDSSIEVNPDAQELCDTIDNDCDGTVDENEPTWFVDDDLDGFGSDALSQTQCDSPGPNWAANDSDCDDSNADVKPGAPEVCNGLDDDCDTKVDDDDLNLTGEPTWYADGDSDTYGDSADVLRQCNQPAGYVDNSDDCNDAVGTTNPGAPELCNGVDDDCSGAADNGLTFDDYYLDSDGDTYGDEGDTSPVNACEPQSGRVTNNDDCDDSTDTVSPADTEICNGVDDDCAGGIDDGLSTADYWPDDDDDGYGDEDATPVNDCAQPPDTVTNGDDCDDTDEDISPADAEVCNGVDDDCAGGIDDGLSTADYWPDDDDDGYGDEDATPVNDCAQPPDTVTNGDDCDDDDPDISPGDPEVCDGIDNDCSGVPDNGLSGTTYYVDSDGDGQGDENDSGEEFCSDPGSTHSANNDDCDDSLASVFDGATEVCDGQDTDCDGNLDDQPGWQAWYTDGDTDTYGDDSTEVFDCTNPGGLVSDNTDCDDTETDVNPGETEVCGDGVDNDCANGIDDGCTPLDCLDILQSGDSTGDDWYDIDPDGPGGDAEFSAYCDMTRDGGGWTRVYTNDFSSNGTGWSATTRYNCNGDAILGRFGGTTDVTRTIDTLGIRDSSMRLDVNVYEIDSVQSTDAFVISIDSTVVYAQDQWQGLVNSGSFCGSDTSSYNRDAIYPMRLFRTGRTSGNAALSFASAFDQSIANEAWGIDDVEVWVRGVIDDSTLGDSSGNAGEDCLEIRDARFMPDTGFYWIDPDGAGGASPFQAWCEMEKSGGGWTNFWWHVPNVANGVTTDMLGDTFSSCATNASKCYATMPNTSPQGLLVESGAGGWAAWEFDGSNDTSVKAMNAFTLKTVTANTNGAACGDSWNPVDQSGLSDNPYSCDEIDNDGGDCSCFWYYNYSGIMSFNLDDDRLYGETAFAAGRDNGGGYGVDSLEIDYFSTTSTQRAMFLYYR